MCESLHGPHSYKKGSKKMCSLEQHNKINNYHKTIKRMTSFWNDYLRVSCYTYNIDYMLASWEAFLNIHIINIDDSLSVIINILG